MESVSRMSAGEPHPSLSHTSDSENMEADSAKDNIIEQSSPCTLQQKIDMLSPQLPQHTIYRVYSELRNVNNEAYEPKLVAIGPYHSHNANLKKMEIHKMRYLKSLLERHGKNIKDCLLAIENREEEARNCYAEPVNLESSKFLEMMVLDGCFIIEYAMRFIHPNLREKGDPVVDMGWMSCYTVIDLLMFENQIPFFIISAMSNMFYGAAFEVELVAHLLNMFKPCYPVEIYKKSIGSAGAKHLLELVHRSFLLTYEDPHVNETNTTEFSLTQDIISSAASLSQCNVKFARTEEGVSMFEVRFQKGLMRLPNLQIDDGTEPFFRNMIAYEQYFQSRRKCYFTDLCTLMDRLINTADDVKLLVKCGVIKDCMESEEAIANMLNKLLSNVVLSDTGDFIYTWHFKKVTEHCNLRRNAWMAKLKKNHFSSPWAIISILAASVLIGLTIVQTVFAVIK